MVLNFSSFTRTFITGSLFFALVVISPFACAAVYPMPLYGDDVVGNTSTITVVRGDSIRKIRMKYGISFDEMIAANPDLDYEPIRTGDILTLPTQYILPQHRRGIVLNMPELRIYYFTPDGKYVYTFPVAMGRPEWRTPTMATKIVGKQENPTWYVPKSVHAYMLRAHNLDLPNIMPPGPDNPLGNYALYLARPGFVIHGTNQQETVGTFASSGCMRLSSSAIETLFKHVKIGAPVHIIHHTNKAGWLGDALYLEVHEPIELDEKPSELNTTSINGVILNEVASHPAKIYWDKVYEVVANHDGIPHVIGEAVNN